MRSSAFACWKAVKARPAPLKEASAVSQSSTCCAVTAGSGIPASSRRRLVRRRCSHRHRVLTVLAARDRTDGLIELGGGCSSPHTLVLASSRRIAAPSIFPDTSARSCNACAAWCRTRASWASDDAAGSTRRPDTSLTRSGSRSPSSRRLSALPVLSTSASSTSAVFVSITSSTGVLFVDDRSAVSPRRHASARTAVTVWLLPVPGGPVITVRGAVAAHASAASCESFSVTAHDSPRGTDGNRCVLEQEPGGAVTPVGGLHHPSEVLDQVARRRVQLTFEGHDHVEHTDFLRPPRITEGRDVDQVRRIEPGQRNAQSDEQVRCGADEKARVPESQYPAGHGAGLADLIECRVGRPCKPLLGFDAILDPHYRVGAALERPGQARPPVVNLDHPAFGPGPLPPIHRRTCGDWTTSARRDPPSFHGQGSISTRTQPRPRRRPRRGSQRACAHVSPHEPERPTRDLAIPAVQQAAGRKHPLRDEAIDALTRDIEQPRRLDRRHLGFITHDRRRIAFPQHAHSHPQQLHQRPGSNQRRAPGGLAQGLV
jgi:hypothetical protein